MKVVHRSWPIFIILYFFKKN